MKQHQQISVNIIVAFLPIKVINRLNSVYLMLSQTCIAAGNACVYVCEAHNFHRCFQLLINKSIKWFDGVYLFNVAFPVLPHSYSIIQFPAPAASLGLWGWLRLALRNSVTEIK